MRFVNFWRLETLQLSKTERIFFRDAISKLQTWEILKKEYADLELIKKILEVGIDVSPEDRSDQETNKKEGNLPNKERIAQCEKTL